MKKKVTAFVCIFYFIFCNSPSFTDLSYAASYKKPVSIMVDGKLIETTSQPIIVNNTTYGSLREIVEAFGGTVRFLPETKEIEIICKDITIAHKPTTDSILSNGQEISLGMNSFISNGTTMIPIKKFVELLGAQVEWNADLNAVIIWTDKVGELNYTQEELNILKYPRVYLQNLDKYKKVIVLNLNLDTQEVIDLVNSGVEDEDTIRFMYGSINRSADNSLMAKGNPTMLENNIFFEDKVFNQFYFLPSYADEYVKSINYYQQRIGNNVKIHCLLVPMACEFYLPSPYFEKYVAPQDTAIQYAYNGISNNVNKVDAYTEIKKCRDQYLYFNSDHHWTALGAYRAYEAFVKSIDEEALKLSDMSMVQNSNPYYGTAYSNSSAKKITQAADVIWYYDINSPYTFTTYNSSGKAIKNKSIYQPSVFNDGVRYNEYSVFMGGDYPYCKIVTENKNAKRILIIKDSFGNAFIPYLIPHYEEIHVIDPRAYKGNSINFINKNGITDLLFVDYSLALGIPDFSKKIKQLAE